MDGIITPAGKEICPAEEGIKQAPNGEYDRWESPRSKETVVGVETSGWNTKQRVE